MKAIVLAAGEGTRLGPFTASEPKVMIPVGNRPILRYVIDALVANGVHDLVLVVGYRRERILSAFEDGRKVGARIEYVVQRKQLGTAHALLAAKDHVQEDFLVLAGDNVVDGQAVQDLLAGPKGNAVLVAESEEPSKYGVVQLSDGRVEGIVEKPAERIGNLISTGIYRLQGNVLPAVEAAVAAGHNDLTAVMQGLAQRGELHAVRTTGRWADALYPWDLIELNALALQSIEVQKAGRIEAGVVLRGPVSVGDGAILRSGTYIQGPAAIGEGCEIGPSACILPTTSLGDDVTVGPFAVVENSLLMNDTSVGPGSTIANSVVGPGVRFGAGFAAAGGKASVRIEDEWHDVDEVGAFIGEDSTLGHHVVAEPGTIVGARSQVASLARLRGTLPPGSLVM